VQFLKVALRATTDLGRLNDKPSEDEHEAKDAHSRWWQAHALLCDIRRAARAAGQLGPADGREAAIVQQWMKALAGDRRAGVSPAITPFDDRGAGVSPAGTPFDDSDDDVDVGCALRSADTRGTDVPSPTPAASEASAMAESLPRVSALAPLAGHTLRGDGSVSNPFSCSNSAAPSTPNVPPVDSPDEATEVASPSGVPTPEPACCNVPPPRSTAPQKKQPVEQLPLSLAERRRRHQEKLRQFHEAQRRGLPIQFVFDPEDGPVPRPVLRIDDYGYVPSPPPSREERIRENEEYLAKLRAQNEANNRRWREAEAQTRS
jgi:hypothetical protein